ncbi:DUF4238 domain-containing protein [Luteibacter aegosomatissinici]|uniref:DUF4238 domain-containing protein n=1 Tax=Luteibacter aegosomatissinici TaxID=2911539 RepID=UPI001FFA5F08|nr:DUF4238 domain-containing protein [Luteibacter aegosomatissinici]UPG92832.1 DUF4238 domain-containing protein [Luteibacter aegosomatissinici]
MITFPVPTRPAHEQGLFRVSPHTPTTVYGRIALDNRNRNQHYVPKYYFRCFSLDEKSIQLMLRKTGKVVPKPASIDKQSSDWWFYGDAATEDAMSAFDGPYSENHQFIVSALDGGRPAAITAEHRLVLLRNMLLQRRRTLAEREAERGVHTFVRDALAPQLTAPGIDESGCPPEAAEALRTMFAIMTKKLDDPRPFQMTKIAAAQDDANALADLTMVFLENDTPRPFIFGDAPVVYANAALCDREMSLLNESSLGLQVFFPLSPRWAVMLYDPETYDVQTEGNGLLVMLTDETDVSELNKLQIHEAHQSIYFHDAANATYVASLWASAAPGEKRGKTVERLPQLTPGGRYLRDVNAIVDPEPSFHPTLGFVSLRDFSGSRMPYRAAHWIGTGDDTPPSLNAFVDRKPWRNA